MKKILITFSFLFLIISISSAQVAVLKATAFVDSVSQPGLKKYGLKLSFDGINVPVIFSTIKYQTNLVYYGDSIPNLLNSSNTMNEMTYSTFLSYAINANNINDTITAIQVSPMSKNVGSASLVASSTGLNCDGKIHYNLNMTDPQIGIGSLTFSIPYSYSILPSMAQTNIDTLCSGKYWTSVNCSRIMMQDSIIWYTESMCFLIGQSAFPSATGLNILVDPYKQANTPLCDGKARVSITNSTMPFLCSFDGASYVSSDSIANLCDGLHRVVVATANDTVGKYFIIADAGNVINNPNPYGTVVDTIIYNFTNCNFDYNIPVDSAFLVNYNVIDTNTIFFSWEIWQAGVLTSISDTVSYNYQTGNSMVSLMIFCGNAKTITNTFKTFRINNYVYLSSTTTNLSEKNSNFNFNIYPNPFKDVFVIKSTNFNDVKEVKIFNLLGENMAVDFKIIGSEIVVNTEKLKSGFYTITLVNKLGNISSNKIIKQ
jgi:hypothetical protein